MAGKMKSISEVLGELVPKLRPKGSKTQQRLWEAWKDAIGREKAGYTKISAFRKGTLHVEVESPAMLQEITGMNKTRIKEAMTEKLKGVFLADIRLKLAKD